MFNDDETTTERVENPFGTNQMAQRVSGALADAQSSGAVAEIQGMMILAKRFPRDEKASVDKILMACTRPSLAEKATYQYARGGTDITGPSIRLAETIAQKWGNIKFGVVEMSRSQGQSEMQAYAFDMETLTFAERKFIVRHIRDKKGGGVALSDERDIYELSANMGARRLRACILELIPGDVVEMAVKQCDTTLRTNIEITPEYLKQMLVGFLKYGVSKQQIEKRIQRTIDSITPAQIVNLGNVFNSLRDGMSEPVDWFEPEAETGIDKMMKATEKRAAAASKPADVKEDSGKVENAAPAGDTQGGGDSVTLSDVTQKLIKAFRRATDIDVLQADATLIETLPPEEQEDARAVYIERLEALGVK
jgi:hypothetical protein